MVVAEKMRMRMMKRRMKRGELILRNGKRSVRMTRRKKMMRKMKLKMTRKMMEGVVNFST